MDENKIISFEEFIKRMKNRQKNTNVPMIDVSTIKRATEQDPQHIEWVLLQHAFAKYKLSLNCLFYHNHQFNAGRNPDSAFFVGFERKDLNKIEKGVCDALKELGRDYLVVDAANKPYRKIVKEICRIPEMPGMPAMSTYELRNTLRQVLYSRDNVIVIKEISGSNLQSRKAGFVRALIKIIDDAHFDKVHPKTDLVFIDYANFLQKIWENVGPYLQVTPV